MSSTWQYNRKELVTKLAVTAAVSAGVVALLVWRNGKKKQRLAYY